MAGSGQCRRATPPPNQGLSAAARRIHCLRSGGIIRTSKIMGKYWSVKIYKDDEKAFVAEYVAETSSEAVRRDLASKDGVLQSYLKRHCGVDDTSKYPSDDGLEALLGALVARTYCSAHFGIAFSSFEAPTAMKFHGSTSS